MRCSATLTEVLVAVLLIFATQVYADEPGVPSHYHDLIDESGVIIGVGFGTVAEGHYNPILLIWHLGCDLKKVFPYFEKYRGTFSAYIEPQVNPVFNHDKDVEFGVGVGMKYRYSVTDDFSWYIIGSVGPHYITVKTEDQANGFIFSDTIGIGCSFLLTEGASINLEYRFRHLSNGGIDYPNGGINNSFIAVGYSQYF